MQYLVYSAEIDINKEFWNIDEALKYAKQMSIDFPDNEVWVDYSDPETIAGFYNGDET